MSFVRTQVYLTPKHHSYLKEEAEKQEIPVTELLRRILDDYMHQTRPKEEFLKIVALGRSNQSDISEHHDKYLAEALEAEHVR